MTETRAPGIYIEESRQRVGVNPAGASLAAMVGQAKRGRTDRPVLCESWNDFVEYFGGFSADRDLGLHAWEFFRNGGSAARFLRVTGVGAAGASSAITDQAGNTLGTAYASNPGVWGNSLALSTQRSTITAIGIPSANDGNGNALPSGCLRLQLPSLAGVNIGDTFLVSAPADGADVDYIRVAGFETASTSIYFKDPGGFVAACPANPVLRTNSMHRARTFLTAEFQAGTDFLDLNSVDGIAPGSILTAHLVSHCDTNSTVGVIKHGVGVVESISGKRVTLRAAFDTGSADIPVATPAIFKYIKAGSDGLQFEAKAAGPDGNRLSVYLRSGQPALSVEVLGRLIRINVDGTATLAQVKSAVEASASANALVSVTVLGTDTVVCGGAVTTALTGGAQCQVVSQEFGLSLTEGSVVVENDDTFTYLNVTTDSADYIGTRVGGTVSPLAADDVNPSKRVLFAGLSAEALTASAILEQFPKPLPTVNLSGGVDGATVTDEEIVGEQSDSTGLYAFAQYEDVDMIAAPGFSSSTVHKALIDVAETKESCVAILDADETSNSYSELIAYRQLDLASDSSYGQLFAPWGRIVDPRETAIRNTAISVPPSPMVCAVISRVSETSGAHTSCGNIAPLTWIGVKRQYTPVEHGSLNAEGVNVIKSVLRRGIRIMGDRTLMRASDPRRFGNARRWLNYFKQSVGESLGSLMFRGGDSKLFAEISMVVTEFLTTEWRRGALYPSDDRASAFYVKCDSETTSPADLNQGNVFVDIGLRPTTAVERIIFRVNVAAGGVQVSEG